MNTKSFEKIINEAWENKNQVNSKSGKKIIKAIDETIELLDEGKIRVAEKKKTTNGQLINGLKKQFFLVLEQMK